MYTAQDISIYVPFYNAGRTIERCIESLLAQTIKPKRLFVIDDGSLEKLPEGIAVEVISHGINKGLAAGRNTALNNCETALIASVDADVIAQPQWLEVLLNTLNDSAAAGVAGRMDEYYQENTGDRWRAVHMAQHWGDEKQENPRFLFGANTLMNVEALRKVGGFDTSCRTNNEDRTVCDALVEHGAKLIYQPKARCLHLRQDETHTILSAYWGWHHAKGVKEGDFDSYKGLLSRIKRVNFGIGEYRAEMDSLAGRSEFIPLDYLLPLVFCCRDLDLYCRRQKIDRFDVSELTSLFVPEGTPIANFIPHSGHRSLKEEFTEYLSEFEQHFETFLRNEYVTGLDLRAWFCDNLINT